MKLLKSVKKVFSRTYRDESLFLYSSSVSARVSDILDDIVAIYNGRRKVLRTVAEVIPAKTKTCKNMAAWILRPFCFYR